MYAEGDILVREDHLEAVLEILEPEADHDQIRNDPARVRRVIEGVALLTLGASQPSALDALDAIDRQLGQSIATPNHVLTVAGGSGTGCPATEPEEVYYDIEPFPSVNHDGGGDGVLVYMADTGLLRDTATHSWLEGVRMANPVEDADPKEPLEGDWPQIPPYTGHGTFVAGVLRCVAPASEIIVQNAFAIAGSELESDLVPRLDAALGLGADIFHLTIACSSRNDLPLIAFQEWLRKVRQTGAVVIAAAGNSGFDRKTWPAAFPGVIGVGALGGDWRGRATFSNFGSWVDVYAPGRDLINAYATGTYKCHVYPYADDEPRRFWGMAKWSGTSFSTPIVTGLIASRMSSTGETARQAAAAVLAEARAQAIPGVGPVLLPAGYPLRPR
jgi:subtilisin family serine protease